MVYKSCFTNRISRLDTFDEKSWINNNEIRGFYAMFTILTISYIASTSLLRFQECGHLLDIVFFRKIMNDAEWMIAIWPLCSLYCWSAWLLQWLVLKGLNDYLRVVFQHLSQSLMFVFAAYMILDRDWGFSQSTFVILLALTHFMKMHSYTVSNRNLREHWLTHSGPSPYPDNLTAANFFWFMLSPVLVYEPSYPQRPFRPWYFLKKLSELCLYLVAPLVEQANKLSFLECIVRLIVPCVALILCLFMVIFDVILNLFAELAEFGDREFYHDWWNASSWEEFNRKWNRPVHLFLYHYIYLECFSRYHWSENTSRFVTFLFSAACHEMVMALVCKTVRPYLLVLMMFQLPLMIVCKPLSNSRTGLYMCWFGITVGPPLLITLYARASA